MPEALVLPRTTARFVVAGRAPIAFLAADPAAGGEPAAFPAFFGAAAFAGVTFAGVTFAGTALGGTAFGGLLAAGFTGDGEEAFAAGFPAGLAAGFTADLAAGFAAIVAATFFTAFFTAAPAEAGTRAAREEAAFAAAGLFAAGLFAAGLFAAGLFAAPPAPVTTFSAALTCPFAGVAGRGLPVTCPPALVLRATSTTPSRARPGEIWRSVGASPARFNATRRPGMPGGPVARARLRARRRGRVTAPPASSDPGTVRARGLAAVNITPEQPEERPPLAAY